jgi:hypothetical protein
LQSYQIKTTKTVNILLKNRPILRFAPQTATAIGTTCTTANSHLHNTLYFNALQKAVFCVAKDGLLACD